MFFYSLITNIDQSSNCSCTKRHGCTRVTTFHIQKLLGNPKKELLCTSELSGTPLFLLAQHLSGFQIRWCLLSSRSFTNHPSARIHGHLPVGIPKISPGVIPNSPKQVKQKQVKQIDGVILMYFLLKQVQHVSFHQVAKPPL